MVMSTDLMMIIIIDAATMRTLHLSPIRRSAVRYLNAVAEIKL